MTPSYLKREEDGLSEVVDWKLWLDAHGPALVLFARNWTTSHAEAEDFVQEAFVRFWPHQKNVSDPVAYIYQCIRRVAIDSSRSSQQRRLREANCANSDLIETRFQSAIHSIEQAELVEQALAALPVEQAEVVTLKIWSELTFDQIAAVTSVSPATAASRYRYAIERLRKVLREGSAL